MNNLEGVSTSRLANVVAREIRDAYVRCQELFRAITRRARRRFAGRDWHGMHDDSAQRLDVYASTIDDIETRLRTTLGQRLQSRILWGGAKAVYSGLIYDREDWEIAETFFNSVTRRVFSTVGVDNDIEFVHTDYVSPPIPTRRPLHRCYQGETLTAVFRRVLVDFPQLAQNESAIGHDAAAAAACVEAHFYARKLSLDGRHVEVAQTVFYRGERAYVVGRLTGGEETVPLVFCFCHGENGVCVDAVLLEEDDVSLLFSYTRSYFHVEIDRPYDMIQFLKSIMPRKRTAEIYIALGYNRHGKTELFRNALRHLAHSSDLYELAKGQRGMVMVVFTMPSYPVVFKIIKDRFDYPKDCTRQEVIDRYRLVFQHDRAGRLVDAQEYKYLVLDRHRFADELLEELCRVASQSVCVHEGHVVIKHCYAERRVTPLNLYVRSASSADARAAVVDYGAAIKDLAHTNLFPGDLLLKNFGVTRNRRVVFYDYDEVCLLSECNFRAFPETGHYEDELAAEPWYGVSPADVFPQEFVDFLGMPAPLKEEFIRHHGDLLQVDFWQTLQQRIEAGQLFHVAPYADARRLSRCSVRPDRLLPRGIAGKGDMSCSELAY